MYLNILKKDLKRKRAMNIILLLFIILAVMFVSSSVNNLMAVTNSLDTYFDKANMEDYFAATKGAPVNGESVEEIIKDLEYVDSYSTEDCLYVCTDNTFKINDEAFDITNDSGLLTPFESSHITFFDSNNNPLTKVNDGEIYMKKTLMEENDISVGDKIKITIGDTTLVFTVKGHIKDALLGSSMMGMPRLLISQNDFDKLKADDESDFLIGQLIYIDTDNTEELAQKLAECSEIVFSGDKALFKTTYVIDMVIAGVLLVLSICLIFIAFIILRFTITFTLSEEYREIGIMKAIGIKNRKIRGLYIVKYFAVSMVGAVVGFICGIPFGNMFLQQASENIMMSSSGYLINALCAVIVIGIIMLFCYRCTGKVKRFTPVDAIRNGETGERYKKKGILRLSKIGLRPVPFMALNDILSGVKRFVVMLLTFTIGILLITIMANTMSTLKSDKLVTWFSMSESDVYMGYSGAGHKYAANNGRELIEEDLKNIEDTLYENDIKAKCFAEALFKFTVSNGEYSTKSLSFQGTGTTTEQYEYIEGTAPQNTNEIALTYIVAEKIHAEIGDTLTVTTSQGEKEYILTAIYQSMNNMGEGIRFHQDEKFDYSQLLGFFSYQIKYTDNPSQNQIDERLELIKDIYTDYDVMTGGEYVDSMIGAAGYIDGIKNIVVIVVMIICILVAVLMEKSFLTKEKGEIAMLKATGFTNGSIILWQTLRIAIVMVFSVLLAIALSQPLGQLSVVGIFRMMGAYNIIFDVNILETCVIYPLAVFAVTVFSVFIVAQQLRRVSSSEINNIE